MACAENYPWERVEMAIRKYEKLARTDLERFDGHRKRIKRLKGHDKDEQRAKEISHANSTFSQIKMNCTEMDRLFHRLSPEDQPRFIERLEPSRQAVKDMVSCWTAEMCDENLKREQYSDQEESLGANEQCQSQSYAQDLHEEEFWRLGEKEQALNRMSQDLESIQTMMNTLHDTVHRQRDQVDSIENYVQSAEVDVHAGGKSLVKASRLKVAAVPIVGALVGGLIGGPVGLVVGIKAGLFMAATGAAAGLGGGMVVKKIRNRRTAALAAKASGIHEDGVGSRRFNGGTRELGDTTELSPLTREKLL